MRRQGWVLALSVLVTVGGLAAAGRLLELPGDRPFPAPSPPSTAPDQVAGVATLPPGTRIPRTVWRPLRLPGLGRDGSCPTSPAVGPPRTADQPVAAVAVGDGPVYPVLAHPDGWQGHWWRPTRLRAAAGCYGLQIDGPRFSQVVVVEFA